MRLVACVVQELVTVGRNELFELFVVMHAKIVKEDCDLSSTVKLLNLSS